jgi:hypothetical protein
VQCFKIADITGKSEKLFECKRAVWRESGNELSAKEEAKEEMPAVFHGLWPVQLVAVGLIGCRDR